MFRFLFDECNVTVARVLRAVVLLFLLCAVAGCSGGDSSKPTPDPTPDDGLATNSCTVSNPPSWCDEDYAVADATPRAVTFEVRTSPSVTPPADPDDYATKLTGYESTFEYTATYTARNNPSTLLFNIQLPLIKAASAYARGATGKDVTITIVDTGIRTTHNEFGGNGKVTVRNLIGSYMPEPDDLFHGTAVAALAAGRRNDDGIMHGVAFDAHNRISVAFSWRMSPHRTLNRLAVPDPDDDGRHHGPRYNARFLSLHPALLPTATFLILVLTHARCNQHLFPRRHSRRLEAQTAAVLAQAGTPDADKKIIAWAAGNARRRFTGSFRRTRRVLPRTTKSHHRRSRLG